MIELIPPVMKFVIDFRNEYLFVNFQPKDFQNNLMSLMPSFRCSIDCFHFLRDFIKLTPQGIE